MKKLLLALITVMDLTEPGVGFAVQVGDHSGNLRAAFEVASIKPCKTGDTDARGARRDRSSPGRLSLGCQPLASLIQWAYLTDIERASAAKAAHVRLLAEEIKTGPAWIHSERYQVQAKAEGTPSEQIMRGPMMQTLLEDRFKLRIHRATRQIPAYALTVVNGGVKLHSSHEGRCIPLAENDSPTSSPPGPAIPICGHLSRAQKRVSTRTVRQFRNFACS